MAETNDVGESAGPDSNVDDTSLDDWASKGDEKDFRQGTRPRQTDGKYARSNLPSGTEEAEKVLRETKNQIDRDERNLKQEVRNRNRPKREEAEEEENEFEEQAPKPKTSRKVKALVNGAEETIDLDDEEYQKINAVQAMRASQKAFREAAQMRKEVDQLKETLQRAKENVRQDPMKLFKALGIDENDVANFAQQMTINRLSETIDPTTGQPYTPEQQRIIQLQKTLQGKEQLEQETKQQQEAAEFEKVKEVVRQDIDRKFTSALQETGLPTTQYTMMRLADLMESLGPDVDPMTVAPMVVEDMINEFSSVANGFPIEVVAEILGDKFLNKLRKWDIDKSRQSRDKFGRNPQRIPGNSGHSSPQSRAAKITNPEEAAEWLDKWAGQGR